MWPAYSALPSMGLDSSEPPCSGFWRRGVIVLESRLWRRLQWLITQQSTHPLCPLHPPNISILTPAPAPCPLAQTVDTQLLASYTHIHTCSLMIDRRKERLCGLSSCERLYCVFVCACIHAYCDATCTTSALHFPIFRHHLDQNQFDLAYLILQPFMCKPENLTSGSISPAGVISSSFLGGCVNLRHLLLVPTAHTSQTPN